jgi:glutaryl-CoA dehydrogenase
MYPIHDFGSEEQKQKWLPAMARGEKIGCFGLTEPDFGSNPGGIQTRARKDGDSWILNGNKMWITNGTTADIAVIWARTEDGTFRGFLVEKGTPGFEAIEIRGKYSLRASDTAELVLEDCRIPAENVLPKTNGLKYALKCLNQARYGIAWGAVGAAQACFDEALRYSKARIQFGKPIASFQLVQQKLAHMASELTKSQLICLRLGRLKEQGKIRHYQISIAKRNNVFHALETARTCRDILGGNGILDEYHSMRHMMNLETVFTYEGTHDIHALVIAEHLTGIPAYE